MTVAIPALPTPVPQSTDPINFDARADAFLGALPATANAMNAQNAENNTLNANVNTKADQVALDRAATGADRVQTGLDRVATGADRVQTGQDRAAAATSASAASTSANGAADAVVSQLSDIKTQTEVARDQALAGLGAADQSVNLAQLAGGLSHAVDMIGVVIKDLNSGMPYPPGTDRAELLLLAITHAVELAGVAARAVAGGSVSLQPGAAATPSLANATDVATGVFFPSAGVLALATAGLERLRLTADGRLGLGTNAPSGLLDVADNKLRVRTAQTPASATAAGNQGEVAWDAGYVYVCISTNVWRRAALAAW